MVTHEQVLDALLEVVDPELFINVVDLGLVYKIDIEEDTVSLDLGLTSPSCPSGPQMAGECTKVIEALEQGTKVKVKLVLNPPWTSARMSDAARDQLGFF